MELPIKTDKKRKPVKLRIKILLTIFIVLLLGIAYEQIGEYVDNKEYQPVGKLINVDGHNMHIWADGTGDATVVFGVGFQMPSGYVDFYPLYSEIEKQARVAVYDKPGYGWSDVTNAPRDIDTITKEIHGALVLSGEKPPYILVAHSIASLEAIRFAQLYKDEVKGVVLIDGSNPDMYVDMPRAFDFAFARTAIFKGTISLANKTGIIRTLFHTVYPYSATPMSTGRSGFELAPEQLKKLDRALFLRTFNNRNQVDEGNRKEENAFTVLSNGYLGDIPLRIITSEYLNSYPESAGEQLRLLEWSTDSKQIIVDGANHAVHWSNPGVINKEIVDLLNTK
ncbi:Pimeloyl-ACP methyl ester carboxylesterase [Sporobacter termitidis DSM 10068]|uniref:Pimeloyl-ACP methyl ester carboxylesterase n=1 Tax=Sporobacter termitidis DSM 10068 TaxID=1123282 RepID=A0A1M5U5S4_9FIRM|nr:alpha/beta hydrolase [Sporobacter termitidis]SHH58278.1 Pimeloyl-ACP methyl ester carboxylesterase [Sporobacter termitidis DSM 10068]